VTEGRAPTTAELLDGCAREAIHIPEAVQPFGAVVGVDAGGRVVLWSQTAGLVLGESAGPADLGGLDLARALPGLEGALAAAGPGGRARARAVVGDGEVEVTVLGDVQAGATPVVLVDLEPDPDAPVPVDEVAATQLALLAASSAADLLDHLVVEVRGHLGFDRVMAYRFDPDWNGEVVAEARRDDLDPYLGLRYPASDIPPQARAMYRRTPSRVIPDVDAPTVPLVHLDPAISSPADLSRSIVRAVSPVHLEYLRAMGVRASMSLALVVDGELWGLVACHHVDGPHRPGPSRRRAAEALVQLASARLESLGAIDRFERRTEAGAALARLRGRLEAADDLLAAVVTSPEVLDLLDAVGVTVSIDGHVGSMGTSRPVADALALLGAGEGGPDGVAPGDDVEVHASAALPAPVTWSGPGLVAPPGALAVGLGEARSWIVWWRPELIEEVRWAGDPGTKVVVDDGEGGVRLGPRRSFAAYAERVTGRSRDWDAHDRWVAGRVAAQVQAVLAGRLRSRQAARWAVQRILDDASGVPGGVEVAVRSQPAGDDPAGGDWFDVVPLPNGAVALAVGDVAGHGFGLASTMTHLRHALRAYLVAYGDAAVALEHLGVLVRHLVPGQLATALVCVISADGREVSVASTGHLPPFVVAADEVRVVATGVAPAVGMRRRNEVPTVVEPLGPGDVVVMVTDGLVERRGERLDDALAALRADLDGVRGASAETVADAAAAGRLGTATDDVTVVAFRAVPR
jgi:chemotaxis family two-component system sensor kinase Cph1